MTENNDHTHITHTPASASELHAVVRRARIEHIAAELLRVADAMRAPVAVTDLYQQPPINLWPATTAQVPAHTPELRMAVARLIAQKVGDSNWSLRHKLVSARPFSASEIEMFAIALLLPSTLISSLSARQHTPDGIAQLFQVPYNVAAQRLRDLGYAPGAPHADAPGNATTQ